MTKSKGFFWVIAVHGATLEEAAENARRLLKLTINRAGAIAKSQERRRRRRKAGRP